MGNISDYNLDTRENIGKCYKLNKDKPMDNYDQWVKFIIGKEDYEFYKQYEFELYLNISYDMHKVIIAKKLTAKDRDIYIKITYCMTHNHIATNIFFDGTISIYNILSDKKVSIDNALKKGYTVEKIITQILTTEYFCELDQCDKIEDSKPKILSDIAKKKISEAII